ncbi:MAG TPA: ABC transporter ATP-binding protein [Candidatus Polarisedimenticolaceae bacterium]|nr:ABC transporter ATP-binding protein [Candidatus Polarisedimenticolaceae bacterium]
MIRLVGVEKHFVDGSRTHRILRGVSLDVNSGDYVAIMGSSGTGKTTLMNIIGLLDRPTAGAYSFENEDVTSLSDAAASRIRNQRMGFVFQLFNLLDDVSAVENVLLPLLYSGHYPDDARRRAVNLLGQVGLADRINFKPPQMSGGQQQRIAIARALINDPPLILADEPTGNLDANSAEGIMDAFDELHTAGRTIVLVTHDAAVARRAPRIIRLESGVIASDENRSN